ncbi:hypothetical protein T484DRAFT_1809157 [Baffinella frigidus]|nr:hypothetical protein T484DRAFT_1809157 [Cryptophyta sp. CCMP2293]
MVQVLMGAERLINTHGVTALLFEFAPKLLMANGVDPAQLLEWVHDHGFRCFDCSGEDQQEPPAPEWFRDLDLYDIGFRSNSLESGDAPPLDPGRFCDMICI